MYSGAVGDIIGDVDGDGAERVRRHLADLADALELLIVEDRLRHLQPHMARCALEVEQIGSRPDERHQRHHQLLADRIDRRVGHLGEVLLEIGVEQLGAVGQGGNRRVGAHRADRFLAGLGHRLHQELDILLGIAESLLAIDQRHLGAAALAGGERQVAQHDLRALEPVAIGVAAGEIALQLVIGDDAPVPRDR